MWTFIIIALAVIFLVGDTVYLYRFAKKYWQRSSMNPASGKKNPYKVGLSSLDLPGLKRDDTDSDKKTKP